MKLLIGVVLFFGVSYAQAQTTWQGLSFGMKHQQVRDTLSAKGFSLHGSDEATTATVEPDLEVKTNSATLSANLKPVVATASMFFKPELSFDVQGGLQTVKLDLDQAKVLQSTPALQPLAILPYIAGTTVFEQLTGKYGPPDATRGPCDNISLASLVGTVQECSAKWKDAGQTIELFWSWSGLIGRPEKLSFFISYSSGATTGL
ncbi:MAG: hypothetical protein ABSG08_04710 [Terriglobales bacterium]|jgi:hypothetical protein